MFKLVLLAASLSASVAFAADHPRYAAPPDWVKAVPIPQAPADSDGKAVQVLLSSQQTRFGPDGAEGYGELAFKVLKPEGLALVNALAPTWDPATETLTLHRFEIIRGAQTIDLLGGGSKVTVLRRETNLELAALDGRLTAALQPQDLQVGDIVDLALTIRRNDPALKGRFEALVVLPAQTSTARFYVRDLWSATTPMQWKATEGLPAPAASHVGEATQLLVDAANAEAPDPPAGAPLRFADLGQLQLSSFGGWANVSALMAPLYDKASELPPGSALKAQVARIAAASADPKTRAALALRLVQDQVRYLFLGLNLGGYVPADADLTWSRRFGDCKAKTALLLALLHGLGIEAQPALANLSVGDMIPGRLPALSAFDHVLVRARIGDRTYWLDGTRSGDRAIDDIPVPCLHWVLPVQASGATLEKVEPPPLASPAFESLLHIDARAGLDAPAAVHAEQTLRGDDAVMRNAGLSVMSRSDSEKSLREVWRQTLPWVDPQKVGFVYEDDARVLRLTMDGAGKPEWARFGANRELQLPDSSDGYDPSFTREPGPHRDAPYAVAYPTYAKWTDVIVLPDSGAGFAVINGGPVDQTVAGVRYQRSSQIEAGVVTMIDTSRSVAPEFPAAEADADAAALRQLYQFDVVIRAPATLSGVERAQEGSAETSAAPKTAEDYVLRGDGHLRHGEIDLAIADFDEAATLDPTLGRIFYNRGVAELRKGEDAKAIEDIDRALTLDPKDLTALEGRAQYYLSKDDTARAQADFDAAARYFPGDHTLPFRRATALERTGRFEAAVKVLESLGSGGMTAPEFNQRCWFRAEWGQELQAALDDCAAGLKLAPGAADLLDSRALVELRLGQFDASVADYGAAIERRPSQAASYYGRGIAEIRSGRAAQAAADLAKARSLDASVESEFRRMGVQP